MTPHTHYAAAWPTEDVVRSVSEISDLGSRYIKTADGPEKQALLLDLCQCFHGYLMKYLRMICSGHVPVVGVGKWKNRINSDAKAFIQYFLPKDQPLNSLTVSKVVKHFHLAFKGMSTEEIYDVLMSQLISAIAKYDPDYKARVKEVVKVIKHELPKRGKITTAAVNRHLGFDSDRYLRLLARHRFLEFVKEGQEKRISGFARSVSWPPPSSFFEGSAIGLAYYLQKWFRFGLQNWIHTRMQELESKEGVYSLEAHRLFAHSVPTDVLGAGTRMTLRP